MIPSVANNHNYNYKWGVCEISFRLFTDMVSTNDKPDSLGISDNKEDNSDANMSYLQNQNHKMAQLATIHNFIWDRHSACDHQCLYCRLASNVIFICHTRCWCTVLTTSDPRGAVLCQRQMSIISMIEVLMSSKS